MAYYKPQSPLKKGDDYFYPLTTISQIIKEDNSRLSEDDLAKATFIDVSRKLYENRFWGSSATYTATEDCVIIAMNTQVTGLSCTINGVSITPSLWFTNIIIPIKSGDTITCSSSSDAYMYAYGLKR